MSKLNPHSLSLFLRVISSSPNHLLSVSLMLLICIFILLNPLRIIVFLLKIHNNSHQGRSKVFPLQAWAGPWRSSRLRLRIFSTFGTMKVVRSSPLRTGRLYPQEFSWYTFLKAESTPGHMVPSVASEQILSDTIGDRSRDPSTSSAVP
jgi:hypothetical protein